MTVTVVLPCFNAAPFIEKALENLSQQTCLPTEIIIIDDCSQDETVDLIEDWLANHQSMKLRTKIIKLNQNIGPGLARNIGVRAATNNFIAFFDADDVWFPKKIEIQLGIHKVLGCAVSCTGFKHGRHEVFQDKTDYYSLLKNNVVNTSTVMFDRSKIDLEFDSAYKSEDYVAWLAVAKNSNIQFINLLLAERVETDGLSSNKFAMAKRRWQIYREIEKLPFFAALYYSIHYVISGLSKHLKT